MLDTNNTAYLKSCQFGPKSPYCPIFRLGSVVSWTGSNFQDIAKQVGGVLSGSPPWGPKGCVMRRVCVGGPMGWAGPAKSPAPGTSCFQNLLCLGHSVRGTLGLCHLVLSRWGSS